MGKCSECPNNLGNPLLPIHLLPFPREELLSHSWSGPGSLTVPMRLFILIKSNQLIVVCLFNILLLNRIATPEMQLL